MFNIHGAISLVWVSVFWVVAVFYFPNLEKEIFIYWILCYSCFQESKDLKMKSDMVRKLMEKGYRVKVPTFYIWHMLCLVASLVFVHHQQPSWLNLKWSPLFIFLHWTFPPQIPLHYLPQNFTAYYALPCHLYFIHNSLFSNRFDFGAQTLYLAKPAQQHWFLNPFSSTPSIFFFIFFSCGMSCFDLRID